MKYTLGNFAGQVNFDEKDEQIVEHRELQWNRINGPRVGDFVQMKDGTLRRFTWDWETALQTTCTEASGDASFYLLDGGLAGFSGSLSSSILKETLQDTGETKEGLFWIFHHNECKAHNGVRFKMLCRVYRQI
jgi:hypothetical protein